MGDYIEVEDAKTKTCPLMSKKCAVGDCMFWQNNPTENSKRLWSVDKLIDKYKFNESDKSELLDILNELIENASDVRSIGVKCNGFNLQEDIQMNGPSDSNNIEILRDIKNKIHKTRDELLAKLKAKISSFGDFSYELDISLNKVAFGVYEKNTDGRCTLASFVLDKIRG